MGTLSQGASGVPIARKLPKVYLQVLFGASPNGAGGGPRKLCLVGQKRSTGTATVDTQLVQLTSVDDAVTYFGSGSELHLMAKAAFKLAPAVSLYGLAVTEATGVAGSATITVANAAGGSGNLRVTIHGEAIDVTVTSGDAANTVAAAINAAINAAGDRLLVTSTVLSAVVTVTVRHKGARFNAINVRAIADSTITTQTYTVSGSGKIASGTGTETLTTPVTTLSGQRFHYIAVPFNDTTMLQTLQTHLLTQAGPTVGKRTQLIYATPDTLGNATTQTGTLNEPRIQCLWMPNSETYQGFIAAGWAGRRAVEEGTNLSVNLSTWNPNAVDLFGVVVRQYADSDLVTDTQANSALDVGITPVQVRADGHAFVPLSVTTKCKDSGGNPDYRTLTTNYVTVPDAFADEFEAWAPGAFPNCTLRDDPLAGDDDLPQNATTPGAIKSSWHARTRTLFESPGHIRDLDTDYGNWAFNLVTGNANRVNATMPITPSPWLTQLSAQVRQQTPST